MKFDAIIIGAGAAGLFCAIEAGKRGRKVLVLEHNSQVGRKILISGGGRRSGSTEGRGGAGFVISRTGISSSSSSSASSFGFPAKLGNGIAGIRNKGFSNSSERSTKASPPNNGTTINNTRTSERQPPDIVSSNAIAP